MAPARAGSLSARELPLFSLTGPRGRLIAAKRSTGRRLTDAWLGGSRVTAVGPNGLILLGLVAVIFAIVVARVRRRLGMTVSARFFFAAAAVSAIVILIFWARQR
jgi:hypothetical protein